MATITYFEKVVMDDATKSDIKLDCGTTGHAGEGPQIYINLGSEGVILSHADAEKFCSAVADIGRYFGYRDH